MKRKYPCQKVIFVDVDDTLIKRGKLNNKLVEWCKDKKLMGFKIILWSSAGEEYARKIATRFELLDIFETIISKPGYIVDDKGWGWIKFTKVINL